MSIDSEEDLDRLKRIGRIVGLTVAEMAKRVRPGMTTAELDAVGAELLSLHGARSAPSLAYDFPGVTCISLNDEAAHGIPGPRPIREGDLVNIDVSAELDGYYADAATTVQVPPVDPLRQKLCNCTQNALKKAMASATAGKRMNAIGRAVEEEAGRCGFHIIRDLGGHGVGRHIHEEPRYVLNYYDRFDRRRLREGMVITIEPFLSTGAEHVLTDPDGWTLRTPDGSLSVQYEHTIVITRGAPLVVTQV